MFLTQNKRDAKSTCFLPLYKQITTSFSAFLVFFHAMNLEFFSI